VRSDLAFPVAAEICSAGAIGPQVVLKSCLRLIGFQAGFGEG